MKPELGAQSHLGFFRTSMTHWGSKPFTAIPLIWIIGQLLVVALFDRPLLLDRGADSATYKVWAEDFPNLDGPQWGYSGFILLMKVSHLLGIGMWLVLVVTACATMLASFLLMNVATVEYGPAAGWAASTAYLLHPLVSQWFKYALTDALFAAGVIGVAWCCWRLSRAPTRGLWGLFVAVLLVTSSLRPTGIVLVGSALSVCVALLLKRLTFRILLIIAIWLALAGVALGTPAFSAGSESGSYSLLSRAVSGEIVYGDSTRAIAMPPSESGDLSNVGFLKYVVDNPLPNAQLFVSKIVWELGQIRPWYSNALNLYIGVFMACFYLLVTYATFKVPRRSLTRGLLMLSAPFVAFIGVTWAIWEGRFAWWFLSLWFVPFGGGVQASLNEVKKLFSGRRIT